MLLVSLGLVLGACSNSASNQEGNNKTGNSKNSIEIAFRDFGSGSVGLKEWLNAVKEEFEQQHSDVSVRFVPIQASEGDFFAKLALMVKNEQTAPDIVTEDTFMINSDAAAGNIDPLDKYIEQWDDWKNFNDRCKLSLYFGIKEAFFCTILQKALSPFLKECAKFFVNYFGRENPSVHRRGRRT
ncbi:ABC transporter substrate-binding protein [Geobacillus sp. PA-3]|nr:ABC transporter substrate-binding protein [Geobacillus sp. PA-3]